MTAPLPSPAALDRFGLHPLADDPFGPPRRPSARWVPIRDLKPHHRPRILDHLLSLSERDRYLRFGFRASTEQVQRYVAALDFRRDEVFGVFNRQLRLVAVAHLAPLPPSGALGEDSAAMEFGVSVSPQARGQGLGLRLFEHAVMHARNRHATRMVVHALAENLAMLKIAIRVGAHVEQDGPDAQGWLRLPPDTMATHLSSSLRSLAAETSYAVMRQALQWGRWLRAGRPRAH